MTAPRPTDPGPTPGEPAPLERLRREIGEQPEVAARLLDSAEASVGRVAELVRRRGTRFVVIAARGTSDNAAIYAQYLLGLRNGLPVALATPSLTTLYGTTPRYEDALVVAISQSGASPDVRAVVEAARAQGAPTVALTNDPASPLAAAAEHVVALDAGEERSVAATKTYSAELVVLAMLSVALDGDAADRAALRALPAQLGRALGPEVAREAVAVAVDQAGIEATVVLGRGLGYPTAREWSLKLKEIAGLPADPYSIADFLHGPSALLRPGGAVFAPVGPGAARDAVVADLARLRDERGAELFVVSGDPGARALGRWSLPVPTGHPEWLEPIVSIAPLHVHAVELALARGVDPTRPHGLSKVTLTR